MKSFSPLSPSFSHRRGAGLLGLAAINQPVPWIFVVVLYPNLAWLGAFAGLAVLLALLYVAMGYADAPFTRALGIGAGLWAATQPIMWPHMLLGGWAISWSSTWLSDPTTVNNPANLWIFCGLATFVYGLANWLLALLIGGGLWLLWKVLIVGYRAVFPTPSASP